MKWSKSLGTVVASIGSLLMLAACSPVAPLPPRSETIEVPAGLVGRADVPVSGWQSILSAKIDAPPEVPAMASFADRTLRIAVGPMEATPDGTYTVVLDAKGCVGARVNGSCLETDIQDLRITLSVVVANAEADFMTVGWARSCAADIGGGVKCWGDNNTGGLGDGTTTMSARAVEVLGLSSGVRDLAVGPHRSCAVTGADGVECWGGEHSVPTPVPGWTSGIASISMSHSPFYDDEYSCVLTQAGGVECLGNNEEGQLGDGTKVDRDTPVGVVGLDSGVTAIDTGPNHACALTDAGGVKCWGNNSSGQLGDGTLVDSTTPVDVVALGRPTVAISAGGNHTCALDDLGGIACWGAGSSGQLGNGTSSDSPTPVAVIGLDSAAVDVGAGGSHTCALTDQGAVRCWGNSTFGQLGNGQFTSSTEPLDVTGLHSGVESLHVAEEHTCVITDDHGVECWGRDYWGQLGVGGYNFWGDPDGIGLRSTPTDVIGYGPRVSGP